MRWPPALSDVQRVSGDAEQLVVRGVADRELRGEDAGHPGRDRQRFVGREQVAARAHDVTGRPLLDELLGSQDDVRCRRRGRTTAAFRRPSRSTWRQSRPKKRSRSSGSRSSAREHRRGSEYRGARSAGPRRAATATLEAEPPPSTPAAAVACDAAASSRLGAQSVTDGADTPAPPPSPGEGRRSPWPPDGPARTRRRTRSRPARRVPSSSRRDWTVGSANSYW